MRNAVEVERLFLHCDAPACGIDVTVEKIDENCIGRPCPSCGSDLLTREDFTRFQLMETAMRVVNEIAGPIEGDRRAGSLVRVHVHNDDISIKISGGSHD